MRRSRLQVIVMRRAALCTSQTASSVELQGSIGEEKADVFDALETEYSKLENRTNRHGSISAARESS
jgi:hypothetical protein